MQTHRNIPWGRWLGAHATLIAYVAAFAMPAYAQGDVGVRDDLPIEPPTEFDRDHWYEDWFSTSKATLPGLPGELGRDLSETHSIVTALLKDGILVDDTLIVMGGPETLRIFNEHAAGMGIHFKDSVVMVPDQLNAIRRHYAQGHDEALASTASLRASTTE